MRKLIAAAFLAAAFLAHAACGPDKAISYYNLGVEAAKRDDYAEAARLWALSVQYRSDDPEARYNLGYALIKLGRYGEAEVQLREAVALNPMDYEARELLGTSLERQGKLAEAKIAYQASLNIKPTRVPALMGLASIALAENQDRAAQGYATGAVDLDPNNLDANMLLAEAYFRNGEYDQAYAQVLTARRIKPLDPAVLLLYGKVAYARRMYADALDALGRARSFGVASGEIFRYLGLSSLAVGDYPEAERDLKLSIYKDDSDVLAWKGLAETYIRMRKWNDASEAVAKALALDPENAEAALDRAIIAMNAGRTDEAVLDLERLAARPAPPQITSYYLGHAYLRRGDDAKARAAFERFIAIWEGDDSLVAEARAIVDRLAP